MADNPNALDRPLHFCKVCGEFRLLTQKVCDFCQVTTEVPKTFDTSEELLAFAKQVEKEFRKNTS